jgi:hypothetical protein
VPRRTVAPRARGRHVVGSIATSFSEEEAEFRNWILGAAAEQSTALKAG